MPSEKFGELALSGQLERVELRVERLRVLDVAIVLISGWCVGGVTTSAERSAAALCLCALRSSCGWGGRAGCCGTCAVGEVDGRRCCTLLWLCSGVAEEGDEATTKAADRSIRWKRGMEPRIETVVDGRVLRGGHVDEPLLRLLLPLLHALQRRKHLRLRVILSSRNSWLDFLRLRRRWHHAAKLRKNGNALVRARRRARTLAS